MAKRKIYMLHCECGNRLELTPGQAGSEVACEMCNEVHCVGSLRELTQSRCIEKEVRNRSTFQFGIWTLLRISIPIAILGGIGARTDWYILLYAISLVALFGFVVFVVAAFLHFPSSLLAIFWDWVQKRPK